MYACVISVSAGVQFDTHIFNLKFHYKNFKSTRSYIILSNTVVLAIASRIKSSLMWPFGVAYSSSLCPPR